MPKLVSQLAQGNAFSRSAEGGALADEATRVWKVILNAPNETWDINEAVGVYIGDPYSDTNPLPCSSIEASADGESRLVRIVTAKYRSTPGQIPGDDGGQDSASQQPDIRAANFSTSTSLYEAPAYEWKPYPDGAIPAENVWGPVVNKLGDPIDGISRMEAITTIRVTQFSLVPGTVHSSKCGCINEEEMSLGGYLTCSPHTVLFRGVEAAPHVETFGNTVYRGFMNSYEFAYRPNVVESLGECGWDVTPLHTGFNVKAFNPVGARLDQDQFGQPLKFTDYELADPLALPDGVDVDDKVRAMVKITNLENGKVTQNPSAQPVALNDDGTPRDSQVAIPKVLIWRRQVQLAVNLTTTLGLRLE